MVSLKIGKRHEYIYFSPIQDTDWYLCTSMSYDTVNSQVSSLSHFLLTMAVAVFALHPADYSGLFFDYTKEVRKETMSFYWRRKKGRKLPAMLKEIFCPRCPMRSVHHSMVSLE